MKVRIFSKQSVKPFRDLRPQVWFSKLSTLHLHFAHMRFCKPSSSFNVISDKALILDASLTWLAFFYQTMLLYGGYKPQRISKGGTTNPIFANWSLWGCLLLKFCQSTHSLTVLNVMNVSNTIFN